jgi:GNAT superfamily N-acetyltransferase
MAAVTVVRTYLELRSPDALRPALSDDPALRLTRAPPGDVAIFRQLYRDVGGTYHWRDRDRLSDDDLRAHFTSPDVQLWVLHHGAAPAGFFELRRHEDGAVEIVYFGLVARFFGHGAGKHLLTLAAQASWAMGATRVWLHTCTLDSPAALPNYLARGFEPVRTETYVATIPDPPLPTA